MNKCTYFDNTLPTVFYHVKAIVLYIGNKFADVDILLQTYEVVTLMFFVLSLKLSKMCGPDHNWS